MAVDPMSLISTKATSAQMSQIFDQSLDLTPVTDAVVDSSSKLASNFSKAASKSSSTIAGAIKDGVTALAHRFGELLDNAVNDYVSTYKSNYSKIYGYYKLNNNSLISEMKNVTQIINQRGLEQTIASQDIISKLSDNAKLGLSSQLAISKSLEDAVLSKVEPYMEWSSTAIGDLVRHNGSVKLEQSIAGIGKILEQSGMQRFYQSGQFNSLVNAMSYGLSANNRTEQDQTEILGVASAYLGSMTQNGVVVADSTIAALTKSLGDIVTNPLLAAINEQDPLMLAAMAQAGVTSMQNASASDMARIAQLYMQSAQQIGGTASSIISGKSWTDDNISGVLRNMQQLEADIAAGKYSEEEAQAKYQELIDQSAESNTYEEQMLYYIKNIANRLGVADYELKHPIIKEIWNALSPVVTGLVGVGVTNAVFKRAGFNGLSGIFRSLGATAGATAGASKVYSTTKALATVDDVSDAALNAMTFGKSASRLGKVGSTITKVASKINPWVAIASGLFDMAMDGYSMRNSESTTAGGIARGVFLGIANKQQTTAQKTMSVLGNTGKWASIGMGIGTLIAPGVGTLIGAGIGALAGGIAGLIGATRDNTEALEDQTEAANQSSTARAQSDALLYQKDVGEYIKWAVRHDKDYVGQSSIEAARSTSNTHSHRDGISYVPYDGYNADLHTGEEVLSSASKYSVVTQMNRVRSAVSTAASEISRGKDTSSFSTVNYDSIITAIQSAADKIVRAVSNSSGNQVAPTVSEPVDLRLTDINSAIYSI